jgi:hypothetical protein
MRAWNAMEVHGSSRLQIPVAVASENSWMSLRVRSLWVNSAISVYRRLPFRSYSSIDHRVQVSDVLPGIYIMKLVKLVVDNCWTSFCQSVVGLNVRLKERVIIHNSIMKDPGWDSTSPITTRELTNRSPLSCLVAGMRQCNGNMSLSTPSWLLPAFTNNRCRIYY